MRRYGGATLILAALVLGACSGSSPSTLDAAGRGARRVEVLWWQMFWVSMVVLAVVVAGIIWALVRRRREQAPVTGDATRFVIVTGAVVPFLVIGTAYAVGLRDLSALSQPAGASMTVEVTGHTWWWEVRYPGTGAVTANEVHIPVGQPVLFRLTTADVVHSFWVPQLMPKTDLISGRVNETWLEADRAGSYRGECAEYCGLQHAHMSFMVVAQDAPDFEAWLARASNNAPVPAEASARRGLEVFQSSSCAGCHTVRGTTAHGKVGPDLSMVGARWSLGAGAVPNDEEQLRAWITNSQQIKPGNDMPPQPVASSDLPDLLAYLRSLK